MKRLFKNLVRFILRPKWVAFNTTHDQGKPELGLKIWGVVFSMYKADLYIPSDVVNIRRPEKREFGESLRPTR
jgi:hypothetical protein